MKKLDLRAYFENALEEGLKAIGSSNAELYANPETCSLDIFFSAQFKDGNLYDGTDYQEEDNLIMLEEDAAETAELFEDVRSKVWGEYYEEHLYELLDSYLCNNSSATEIAKFCNANEDVIKDLLVSFEREFNDIECSEDGPTTSQDKEMQELTDLYVSKIILASKRKHEVMNFITSESVDNNTVLSANNSNGADLSNWTPERVQELKELNFDGAIESSEYFEDIKDSLLKMKDSFPVGEFQVYQFSDDKEYNTLHYRMQIVVY